MKKDKGKASIKEYQKPTRVNAPYNYYVFVMNILYSTTQYNTSLFKTRKIEKWNKIHPITRPIQRSKLRPWLLWQVEKFFGDQNSGESGVMATILQLNVAKRQLYEKVSLERCSCDICLM